MTSVLVFKTLKHITFFYLDKICGDMCYKSVCECGATTFHFSDKMYCYIPRNESCSSPGKMLTPFIISVLILGIENVFPVLDILY